MDEEYFGIIAPIGTLDGLKQFEETLKDMGITIDKISSADIYLRNREVMSPQFQKIQLVVGKNTLTLHHFTGPDQDDFHDHPFPFTTTILKGGYVEAVLDPDTGDCREFIRREGSTSYVQARKIHKIIKLLDGECITSVVWHTQDLERREPRFYRVHNGVLQSRQWNEKYHE